MPEPFAAFPDVMDVRELAAALHLSRAGAYNLMNEPDFPTLKIGGRKLVMKQDLIAYLRRHTTGAAIPVKSRKKRKSGDNSGPERTVTRPGDFERENAVFPKSRAGKKRRKRPLSRDGAKIKGKERRT